MQIYGHRFYQASLETVAGSSRARGTLAAIGFGDYLPGGGSARWPSCLVASRVDAALLRRVGAPVADDAVLTMVSPALDWLGAGETVVGWRCWLSPQKTAAEDAENLRSMSVRQLARATADGRKVTLHIFDADPVLGYLAAIDSTFYLMLVPDSEGTGFARKMVARDKITLVDLHDTVTLYDEPRRVEMEQIISPFRSWICRHVLGRQEQNAPRKVG